MPDMEEEICIPWFAEKMFYMILPKVLREHVMGDLQEEFYGKVFQKYSLSRARWWYRGQVLKSIRYYILNRKGDIMFFLFSILVFVGISLAAAFLGSNIKKCFIYSRPADTEQVFKLMIRNGELPFN